MPTGAARLPFVVESYALCVPSDGFGPLAEGEEAVEDPGAELEAVDRDPLVDAVEHAEKVQVRRQLERAEAEAPAAVAERADPLRVGPGGQAVRNHRGLRILGVQRGGHRVPQRAVGRGFEGDV